MLGAITILPLDADKDRYYAAIRAALEKRGTSIGRLLWTSLER